MKVFNRIETIEKKKLSLQLAKHFGILQKLNKEEKTIEVIDKTN